MKMMFDADLQKSIPKQIITSEWMFNKRSIEEMKKCFEFFICTNYMDDVVAVAMHRDIVRIQPFVHSKNIAS